jgi:outer membrane protein assembly factor BamE
MTADRILGVVTPYRVEVVQGNVLTKEMIAQVKPGMNRNQVRDILGSPLLADVFHGDRWDYVFTIRRQGTEPQSRKVVALFDGENLKSIDAPADLPGESEFVASITTFKRRGDAPKLALSDAERAALPVPPKAPAAAVEPMGAVRSYPPLEPKS